MSSTRDFVSYWRYENWKILLKLQPMAFEAISDVSRNTCEKAREVILISDRVTIKHSLEEASYKGDSHFCY